MPSYTINEPGDYLVWAAPLDDRGTATVSAVYRSGETYLLGEWSGNLPLADPRGGPVAHIGADAGTTYTTDPENAWLIVRRMHGMRVEFDSQEPVRAGV
jgi:hypothetical protein